MKSYRDPASLLEKRLAEWLQSRSAENAQQQEAAVNRFGIGSLNAIILGIVLALCLLGFRWISLPAVVLAFWITSKFGHYRRVQRCAWILAAATCMSPVDVAPFGSPMHCGTRGAGVRLVPLVYGMPAHTALVAKYGEYYSGGCMRPPMPAQWILTWD